MIPRHGEAVSSSNADRKDPFTRRVDNCSPSAPTLLLSVGHLVRLARPETSYIRGFRQLAQLSSCNPGRVLSGV